MRNQKLAELLHQYFELGVSEGREGRKHDTEAGDAQRVLSEIEAEIAALSAAEPVDDDDDPRIGNFDIEEASIDDGAEIAARLARPAPSVAVKADQPEGTVGEMTPGRVIYFLERFKREEKMLGPHEQWALDFSISALSAQVQDVAGWQLVPKEPTHEMLKAMFEAMFEAVFDGTSAPMIGAGYDAALAAAPAKQEG